MKHIQRFRPSFVRRDGRGEFIEIINRGRWESVLTAWMKKGSILGNHYHTETDIFLFLIKGRARVTTVFLTSKKQRQEEILQEEGIVIPARVAHAVEFLDDSTIILGKSRAHDPKQSDLIDYPLLSPRDDDRWEDAYLHTRRFRWLRQRRIQQFDLRPDDRILDLGCGDGINMEILRDLGVKHVVGVDVSNRLVELARQRMSFAVFVQGSAKKLPVRDQSFDVVFVDSVFHHLETYNAAIQEIYRVLVPSGRLCFIEPHESMLRRLYDTITFSSLASVVSSLRYRKQALIEEQEDMDRWLASEREFLIDLERQGFRKRQVTVDLLSLVGEYEKTGG